MTSQLNIIDDLNLGFRCLRRNEWCPEIPDPPWWSINWQVFSSNFESRRKYWLIIHNQAASSSHLLQPIGFASIWGENDYYCCIQNTDEFLSRHMTSSEVIFWKRSRSAQKDLDLHNSRETESKLSREFPSPQSPLPCSFRISKINRDLYKVKHLLQWTSFLTLSKNKLLNH